MGKYSESDMVEDYIPELDAFELYHKEKSPDRSLGPALPAIGHALSGAAGSVLANAVTYPLSLVITRLQVQKQIQARRQSAGAPVDNYTGILDAVQRIYQTEGGIGAFYSGLGTELGKTAADAFLFFLAYTSLRTSREKASGKKRLSAAEDLGLSMAAGALAKFFTTPLQNVITRKQAAAMEVSGPKGGVREEKSVWEMFEQIVQEKGLTGLWAGYSATLVLTLNPGLTFLFHNSLQRLYQRSTQEGKLGPRATFIVAASSKALASAITYPLAVAKSRSQVSSRKLENGEAGEKGSRGGVEKKVERQFARNTVFGNILKIAQEDGLGTLYAGLGGEVFKGFVQHGLTMSMKERIFGIIVQLYYVLLKAMQRYPSGEELAALAQERVGNVAETGAELVKSTAGTVKASVKENIAGPIGDVYGKRFR